MWRFTTYGGLRGCDVTTSLRGYFQWTPASLKPAESSLAKAHRGGGGGLGAPGPETPAIGYWPCIKNKLFGTLV